MLKNYGQAARSVKNQSLFVVLLFNHYYFFMEEDLTKSILWAFSIGLLGSPHCLAMCGPLVFAFQGNFSSPERSPRFITFQYNVGRVLTYSFLGALVGGVGGGLLHATSFLFLQQLIAVLMGTLIFLIGLSLLNIIPEPKLLDGTSFFKLPIFKRFFDSIQKGKNPTILIGLMMGLIPCGLLYALLLKAATSGNLLSGWLLMFSFGIGTFPAMMLPAFTGCTKSTGRKRTFAMKAAYVLIAGMGVLTALRPFLFSHSLHN